MTLPFLFYHLEVFVAEAIDGNGIAAEVHDELAVAMDTDDIAFLAGKEAGEDAETDVVLGELDEGGTEEGDALGSLAHHHHEGIHDMMGNGGGLMGGAVVDEVILGEVVTKEQAELFGGALQEDETTDGGDLLGRDTMATGLALIADAAMDEMTGDVVAYEGGGLQTLLDKVDGDMGDMDIAPWEGFARG